MKAAIQLRCNTDGKVGHCFVFTCLNLCDHISGWKVVSSF